MNQKTASPAEMHADHRKWKSDISMWQDDINEWQLQMQLALEQLEQFSAHIRREKTEVERHASSLLDITNSLVSHEKQLAETLRAGSESELDEESCQRHAARAGQMEARIKTHEQLKKRHHTAMSLAMALEAVLKATEIS